TSAPQASSSIFKPVPTCQESSTTRTSRPSRSEDPACCGSCRFELIDTHLGWHARGLALRIEACKCRLRNYSTIVSDLLQDRKYINTCHDNTRTIYRQRVGCFDRAGLKRSGGSHVQGSNDPSLDISPIIDEVGP